MMHGGCGLLSSGSLFFPKRFPSMEPVREARGEPMETQSFATEITALFCSSVQLMFTQSEKWR